MGEFKHKILFLCPKYANADTPEQYREWLLAIDDSLDGEVEETNYQQPQILRVFDHILTDDITPEDRARMKDEYGDELLRQEKFEQGVQQGLFPRILVTRAGQGSYFFARHRNQRPMLCRLAAPLLLVRDSPGLHLRRRVNHRAGVARRRWQRSGRRRHLGSRGRRTLVRIIGQTGIGERLRRLPNTVAACLLLSSDVGQRLSEDGGRR